MHSGFKIQSNERDESIVPAPSSADKQRFKTISITILKFHLTKNKEANCYEI